MPLANPKVKQVKTAEDIVAEVFKVRRIKWKNIETKESDEGLLVKGIPVFKTGVHKGVKYDEKYIDNKIIAQFDPDEDVPLQADHSDNWGSTLGWIKKVYRKGKLMLSDLLLVDDNAIARWKKGLMKKWSISISKETGKLSEISAVAFPYVKEAAIHGDVAEVGMKDYVVEETEVSKAPPKIEVEEIEARDLRPNSAPGNSELSEQEEEVQITEDEIENLDGNVETIDWSDGIDISLASKGTSKSTKLSINGKGIKGADDIYFSMYGERVSVRYSKKTSDDVGGIKRHSFEYHTPSAAYPIYNEKDELDEKTQSHRNTLPDSSFALVKNPVKDKATDRDLPYKDADGKVDPAYIRNALARIPEVKGFNEETVARAKALLLRAAAKVGIKAEETKRNKMAEERVESELLKEAGEKETKMAEDIKTKDEKLISMSDELKTKEKEITEFKVDKEIAELKSAGKVLPAQEEKTREFMLSLDDDARAKFVDVLKDVKPAVDLEEKGAQKTEKEEKKFKFDEMETKDIEREVEKYAKEQGIPEGDARDILYEKYSK